MSFQQPSNGAQGGNNKALEKTSSNEATSSSSTQVSSLSASGISVSTPRVSPFEPERNMQVQSSQHLEANVQSPVSSQTTYATPSAYAVPQESEIELHESEMVPQKPKKKKRSRRNRKASRKKIPATQSSSADMDTLHVCPTCGSCSDSKKPQSNKKHRGRRVKHSPKSTLEVPDGIPDIKALSASMGSSSQHASRYNEGRGSFDTLGTHYHLSKSRKSSSSDSLYSVSSMSIKNDSNSDSLSSSSSSDVSGSDENLPIDKTLYLSVEDPSFMVHPRRPSATKSCSAAVDCPHTTIPKPPYQSDTDLTELPTKSTAQFSDETFTVQPRLKSTHSSIADNEDREVDSQVDENTRVVEEDVCFPMQEESHVNKGIDFDELDNFAEEELQKQRQNTDHFRSRQYSTCKPFEPHWNDLSPHDPNDPSSSLHSNNAEKAAEVPLRSSYYSGGRRSVTSMSDSPYRFSFFSSNQNETIHASVLSDLLDDGATSFRSLFCPEKGVWWLDCLDPTDTEMRVLSKAFSIHPLTTEDIRVQEAREKVELFGSYYFVCFRSFEQDPELANYLEPLNMYIVVFREGLLTFHFSSATHPASVRRRARQLRDYVHVSSDWLCYALIDDITDAFVPLIRGIETETEAIEDSVLVGRSEDSSDMLRRIGECRKKTMGMFRLLYGKADVIKMLAKRCNEKWTIAPTGEIGLYLGDIQDHLVTMTSNLSQFEKILSRTHSNYLAQLTSNSIEENSRTNGALGKITLIGTLLVPMNLVTGLFGMNVPVPGRDTNNLAWFFGILGVLLGSIAIGWIITMRYNAF